MSFSMGSPLSLNGSYFQRRTASTAAAFSIGCPETTSTFVTVPVLLMRATMLTIPFRRIVRALVGYCGCTCNTSLPPVPPWLPAARLNFGVPTGTASRLAMPAVFGAGRVMTGATGAGSRCVVGANDVAGIDGVVVRSAGTSSLRCVAGAFVVALLSETGAATFVPVAVGVGVTGEVGSAAEGAPAAGCAGFVVGVLAALATVLLAAVEFTWAQYHPPYVLSAMNTAAATP